MRKLLFGAKKKNTEQVVTNRFITLLFLGCFLASSASIAQIMPQEEPLSDAEKEKIEVKSKKERPEWWDKVHYGGNVWGGFFGVLNLSLTPMAGLEVTEAGTIAGLGATINYQGTFQGNDSQFAIGPTLFVRQPIWRSVFAHLEYEFVNADERQFYSYFEPITAPTVAPEFSRKWEGSPLIGLGFYQGRTRQQGGSFISVMYNLGAPNRGYISPQRIGGGDSPFVFRLGFFI